MAGPEASPRVQLAGAARGPAHHPPNRTPELANRENAGVASRNRPQSAFSGPPSVPKGPEPGAFLGVHRQRPKLQRLVGWGARDRTWDDGTKARCLTAWLRPNRYPYRKGPQLSPKGRTISTGRPAAPNLTPTFAGEWRGSQLCYKNQGVATRGRRIIMRHSGADAKFGPVKRAR